MLRNCLSDSMLSQRCPSAEETKSLRSNMGPLISLPSWHFTLFGVSFGPLPPAGEHWPPEYEEERAETP